MMKVLLICLLLAACNFANSQFITLNPSDYFDDDQVKESLDFGYKWLVEDATQRDVLPRGDYYLSELNNVQKKDLNNGADFKFGVEILSRQRSKIEGTFTVYYKYSDDNLEEDDNNEFGNEILIEGEYEDEWNDDDFLSGPQRVTSYNYHYSYQIFDGEAEELGENSFYPVEFIVDEKISEDGEVDISVLIEQPKWILIDEEELEEDIEIIEGNVTEV